ncbi:MAG: NAD kinase [Crocinitomicaceae bacterium]|nr:NAD kinase [Crocinitomicaceae bacterium]
MKVALFSKSVRSDSIPFVKKLIKELKGANSQIFISPYIKTIAQDEIDNSLDKVFELNWSIPKDLDCLISIGGDGTLLDVIPLVKNTNLPILGINAGRLGFLANTAQEEISYAVKSILEKSYRIDERSLIEVNSTNSTSPFGISNYALNEITIHKKDSSSMLALHAYLNDEFLNTYWADGLIVATPTGSTAYSLSCGGPILSPSSDNFVITPIAPHNLNLRPMVVNDDVTIRLQLDSREDQCLVAMDSRSVTIEKELEIELKRAHFNISLIELPNQNFFKTIRNKLFWGKDVRN